MKYKIIAGPTQMRVERYGFKSEPIDIGNEHIDCTNEKAREVYQSDLHPVCQEYVRDLRSIRRAMWSDLKNEAIKVAKQFPELHFDGPSCVVSTVPWKQAKHSEWFIVSKKLKNLLKK